MTLFSLRSYLPGGFRLNAIYFHCGGLDLVSQVTK